MDQPTPVDHRTPARIDVHRARKRRDAARWTTVVGLGMIFAAGPLATFGGIALASLLGGACMTGFGIVAWAFWGWRLHKADDPWAYDPDLYGPRIG